jgi:branched-chain amino acid transport system ATP-binding protein
MSKPKQAVPQRIVLDVEGLSAGWGPVRVIHDLDLKVFSGERVGLVGLNGHGKSTLFQAIAGLTAGSEDRSSLKDIKWGAHAVRVRAAIPTS